MGCQICLHADLFPSSVDDVLPDLIDALSVFGLFVCVDRLFLANIAGGGMFSPEATQQAGVSYISAAFAEAG